MNMNKLVVFLYGATLAASCMVGLFPKVSTAYRISSSRRTFLVQTATSSSVLFLPGSPTHASLLDEFGSDPNKIVQADSPMTMTTKSSIPGTRTTKEASDMAPNLRSNYYYPTNKKRYLPRIVKCSDQIPLVAALIGNNDDWEAVSCFATTVADDTILPLRLYSSSLQGGGTNVKVSYVQVLNNCANDFERNQKRLVKAASVKDQIASAEALQGMSDALTTYRARAGLEGEIMELPSVDEIRRASSRALGRRFEKGALQRNDQTSPVP
jgi:hypothetical protein